MSKKGTINLETENLILRKLKVEDSKNIFKNWTSNENVSKYMTWSTHKTEEDTKNWLRDVEDNYKKNQGYEWGIVLKSNNELIGSIGVYFKEELDNRYELGYVLAEKYWRKGYTTESAKCVMKYLVEEEGIKSFVGRHAKLNGASGSVMQKVGFRYIKDGWYKKIDGTNIFEDSIYYYDVCDNIEKPKKEDAIQIAKLVVDSWRTTYKGLINQEYLDNLNIQNVTDRWKKEFEQNNIILVYKENKNILGVIKFGAEELEKDKGEIFVLYVKLEERRKGIGTKLLNQAKQELLKMGYKDMIVWCFDENKIGKSFYLKSGGEQKEDRNFEVNGVGTKESKLLFKLREQKEDRIILVKPTKEYEEQAIEYKKEHFDNGENKIHGCGLWDKIDSYDEWIDIVQKNSKKETVSKDWTVDSTFFGVRETDNKIVGMIDIRHELNSDFLRNYAGNIGYGVRPTERKKGYATKMLASALEYCKNEIELEKVMINCHKSNEASRKTIINAGGILEREYEKDGEIIQLYWVSI